MRQHEVIKVERWNVKSHIFGTGQLKAVYIKILDVIIITNSAVTINQIIDMNLSFFLGFPGFFDALVMSGDVT